MQQLAEALQQALLTPPPEPDHLHVVTRYRPAGDHAQIGGDWYDAFLQPDGATMLVIGDVAGHDSIAAAKMGQLRGVLRTLAYDAERGTEPDTPAAILNRLDRVARGLAVDTLATAVLARIEQPQARTGGVRIMRWSNAGHPPPVLLHADGTVDILETPPNLLLGLDPDAQRHDHTIELPDESTLLLYTDGLLERRDETFDSRLVRLREALADQADRDVNELCDAVLARLAPEAGDDDIALVAVRAHTEDRPRPESAGPQRVPELVPAASTANPLPTVGIDLRFDAAAPRLARQFVLSHAVELAPSLRENAELLVSELVTNAIRYGQPDISVRLSTGAGTLRVMVTDRGTELPVLADGLPDPTAASGRGLLIIAAVADDWGVTPDPETGGKSVWFELRG